MSDQTGENAMHRDASSEKTATGSASTPQGRRIRRGLRITLVLCTASACLVVYIGGLFAWWLLRPNTAQIDARLPMEHWPVVSDGMHNSNTDMIHWRGHFYLIHASSPWHLGSAKCQLLLWRSRDARDWESVRSFSVPGEDIRDPKFAIIHDRLFLYALKNAGLLGKPYATQAAASDDGEQWTDFVDIQPKGWLFWRPKTHDGQTWYVPAYWHDHGKSILLQSTDGWEWKEISVIQEGNGNDETDIEFYPDGRMIATARLEIKPDSFIGHRDACTWIGVADPPYTQWRGVTCDVTRLDGPCLFAHGGAVYALGRHNPQPPRFPRYYGSLFGKKRTALYKVLQDRLLYLTDLPSAGDTSYGAVVLRGNDLFACYYTSDIRRDYPWGIGMLAASEIRMAAFDIQALEELARAKLAGK